MAIYHLSVKPIQRSKGRSSVAAAAYRSASELVDERTGLIHDYTAKRGVEYTHIVTPDDTIIERQELWNLAEQAEKRKDGTIAREYEIALPEELNKADRQKLATDFAEYLANTHGCAVDLAIHAPSTEGDERNHHVHILCTTRQYHNGQLAQKCMIELSDTDRKKRGLDSRKDALETIREQWAIYANKALNERGIEQFIDHRSYKRQGLEKAPTIHLGSVATQMERKGKLSDRGYRNRQVYQENQQIKQTTALIISLKEQKEKLLQQQRKLQKEQRKQQYIERIKKMNSLELKFEIKKLTPELPHLLAEQDLRLQQARQQHKVLETQLQQAKQAMMQAEVNRSSWIGNNPKKAKLHQLGLFKSSYLVGQDKQYQDNKFQTEQLASQEREAKEHAAKLAKQLIDQIVMEQKPRRSLIVTLERLRYKKQTQEKQQQYQELSVNKAIANFEKKASLRKLKAFGYGDEGKYWKSLPEETRQMIENYNKANDNQKQTLKDNLKQGLTKKPEAIKMMEQKLKPQNRNRDRDFSL